MKKILILSAAACLVVAAFVRVQLVAQEPTPAPEAQPPKAVAPPPSPAARPTRAPDDEFFRPLAAPTTTGSDDVLHEAQLKAVETAKQAYEAAAPKYRSQNTTLDSVYIWSSRWLAAALVAARGHDEQVRAAREHRNRMRALQKHVQEVYQRGGDSLEMNAANYYVAEAERKLAELKAQLIQPQAPPATIEAAPRAFFQDPEVHHVGPFEAVPQTIPPRAATPNAVRPVPIPNAVPQPENPFAPEAHAQPAPAPSARVPTVTTERAQEPAAPAATPRQTYPFGVVDPYANPTPKTILRYDGKTFNEWRTVLRGDLSPTVRRDAMYALAEFAANGYGREAVEAVFDVIRPYSMQPSDHRERELMDAASFAVSRASLEESLPSIHRVLKSGTTRQRFFAVSVLPIKIGKDAVVPLLVSTLHDADPLVAELARYRLAIVDHDNPSLADWLRGALSSGKRFKIVEALSMLREPEIVGPGVLNEKVAPFPALMPHVARLLGHDDVSVRKQAADCLRGNRAAAIPALEAEASKSATETTSIRARQLLDQLLQQRTLSGPRQGFDWESE